MTSLYMLDTNIVSALVKEPQGIIFRHIEAVGTEAICISIITAAELRFGCAKKASPKLKMSIDLVLEHIAIRPFEMPADNAYGEIRAALEAIGRPIGPNDLFIAAHALSMNATLVTGNSAEFRRVPGLRVENWLETVASGAAPI